MYGHAVEYVSALGIFNVRREVHVRAQKLILHCLKQIYINLDTDEPVACNYCGLLYVYVEKPGDWARRQKAKQEKESQ